MFLRPEGNRTENRYISSRMIRQPQEYSWVFGLESAEDAQVHVRKIIMAPIVVCVALHKHNVAVVIGKENRHSPFNIGKV